MTDERTSERTQSTSTAFIYRAMASAVATTTAALPDEELLAKVEALTVQDGTEAPLPAHRNHDPQNNLKRSDPFQFGSRYLQENDDVFEFNAWDHVETDDTYKEYAEQQYAMQRESPVSDFDKSEYTAFSITFGVVMIPHYA